MRQGGLVTAFKFTSAEGQIRFGRFRVRPEAGTEFLSPEKANEKTADFLAAEMSSGTPWVNKSGIVTRYFNDGINSGMMLGV
jgi:hypothetical protein